MKTWFSFWSKAARESGAEGPLISVPLPLLQVALATIFARCGLRDSLSSDLGYINAVKAELMIKVRDKLKPGLRTAGSGDSLLWPIGRIVIGNVRVSTSLPYAVAGSSSSGSFLAPCPKKEGLHLLPILDAPFKVHVA